MRMRSSCIDASCQRPQAGFSCAYEGGPSVIPATCLQVCWHASYQGRFGHKHNSIIYMMCMWVFHERLGTMER